MGFWLYTLLCNLLIPAIMLIFGLRFRKKAPDRINSLFGYRTERSMKNRETWEFAHRCIGSAWVRFGIAALAMSAGAMLLLLGKDTDTVGTWSLAVTALDLVLLVIPIVLTERALRRNFDKYGRKLTP
ncbi:MAG: SdpI family protein [Oscillospiraceae bacterium]|nr:SdpI family protein [Oscillospiraceae bacterium]